MMKTWLIADTHFNHDKIATYCQRPANFTDLIRTEWTRNVKDEDLVIHLGDVMIGKRYDAVSDLPGRKVLVMGNHDRQRSTTWWMRHGFALACDSMVFRNTYLTHEPALRLAPGTHINIHGHLHNFTHHEWEYTPQAWHRLFAVEFTNYRPVEFDKFLSHQGKYNACIHALKAMETDL